MYINEGPDHSNPYGAPKIRVIPEDDENSVSSSDDENVFLPPGSQKAETTNVTVSTAGAQEDKAPSRHQTSYSAHLTVGDKKIEQMDSAQISQKKTSDEDILVGQSSAVKRPPQAPK